MSHERVGPRLVRHLRENEIEQAAELLAGGAMFRHVPRSDLRDLARSMKELTFKHGDVMIRQGDRSTNMYILAKGHASRLREKDGVEHQVDTKGCGTTINSLHLPREDRCFATARCASDECKAYTLTSTALRAHIMSNPSLAIGMVESLADEVRKSTKNMRTPFLEQHAKEVNFTATALAAGIESFFRSALNAMINAKLTGERGALFPNMHLQVPTRVLYISGLKGIRAYMDKNVHPDEWSNPTLVRWFEVLSPGLVMTPISSVLEASNAGHLNPEPMQRRWMRGVFWRMQREIIFAAGLNQLSDFFEERVSDVFTSETLQSDMIANVLGSMGAGVVAGYFSHVPHNLSTLKLMHPQKSYTQLFGEYVERSAAQSSMPLRSIVPASMEGIANVVAACIFPKGCLVRTMQIVGSFALLNGTINILQKAETKRALRKFGLQKQTKE
eukprot:TRINITY_DN2125_c0_g1_i2.p1 TRINITY_DN2125_c0_g1~~TRINITY_DN2125_c0_g1_i2.p1  ORF type:complete len:444 (+),score=137.11 TRINITY_DN2125_c0_g1_i2:89-1420(+)